MRSRLFHLQEVLVMYMTALFLPMAGMRMVPVSATASRARRAAGILEYVLLAGIAILLWGLLHVFMVNTITNVMTSLQSTLTANGL